MAEETATEVLIFNSSSDLEASAKFEAWRRANKTLGHYLNLNPTQGWFLHRARCPSVPDGNSADNEKRCGGRRKDLERHAAEQGITYKRCQQCNPL
jgi:hypothetical protein